ncbi:TetR/AcrR family transcriptional regulator [Rugosimonospora acidiphila]|uniref:TetR/AcrR family transcriptional regulator n=1 Tax=Rugosimonospora acidiphila TaxID=556531 RepID=A0ABP9RXX9_9ACTN
MIGITAQRRRGTELEGAILRATWDELAEVGYARLTMEGVAARAGTGKQVLYRRWPNRVELVLSAIRHRWSSIVDDLPDTGSVRGDVLDIMQRMVGRFRQMPPDLISGILTESGELRVNFIHVLEDAMATILERGAERGEVRLDAVTPRIARLPTDLIRHELLLRHRVVDESTLTEIVDDIFLPLLRPA